MIAQLAWGDHPCTCVAKHVPKPAYSQAHHIWPLAWGGPKNGETAPLCGTGHDAVHALLRSWERAGAQQPIGSTNRYLYDIAARGWAHRPQGAPA